MLSLTAKEKEIRLPVGQTCEFHLEIRNEDPIPRQVIVTLEVVQVNSSVEPSDWTAYITGLEEGSKPGEYTVSLAGGASKLFVLNAVIPKGASYGDKISFRISASSGSETQALEVYAIAVQSIFAVKTSIGHEIAVMDAIESHARSKKVEIKSMLVSDALRGYVLVEAMSLDKLRELVRSIPKARSVVEGETTLKDIEHYLVPKKTTEGISIGDIVEIVSGGFKGEKARVLKIDELKEEITVELFEAIVPIPITVRGESVKLLEKKKA